MRKGFTLVELLVVLLIVAILVAILAPRAEQTIVRAKESAVKAHCASIDLGLATFASRHEGFYPGLATDCMAPFNTPQALGDPAIYSGGSFPPQGDVMQALFGGFGHYNLGTSLSVQQQIAAAKATPLNAGNTDYQRTFDALILDDDLQEYPANPFLPPSIARANRMRNVFWIESGPQLFADFTDLSLLNDPGNDVLFACSKPGAVNGYANVEHNAANGLDLGALVEQFPYALPYDGNGFNAESFALANMFGTGKNNNGGKDFFSPGDFAYVPVLSTSATAASDDPTTVRDESYGFGVAVRDYLLFGYGSEEGSELKFKDEQAAFAKEGLPGYGAPGIDTRYEMSVLCLFNGAVYFSKSY